MRLIDADALMAELEREVELADDWNTAHEIANVVKYAPTVCGWISVKDRMPDEKILYADRFLICKTHIMHGTRVGVLARYKFRGEFKWEIPGEGWEITHWMPLPEPPKEDANG